MCNRIRGKVLQLRLYCFYICHYIDTVYSIRTALSIGIGRWTQFSTTLVITCWWSLNWVRSSSALCCVLHPSFLTSFLSSSLFKELFPFGCWTFCRFLTLRENFGFISGSLIFFCRARLQLSHWQDSIWYMYFQKCTILKIKTRASQSIQFKEKKKKGGGVN